MSDRQWRISLDPLKNNRRRNRAYAGQLKELAQRQIGQLVHVPNDNLKNVIMATRNRGTGNDLRTARDRAKERFAISLGSLVRGHRYQSREGKETWSTSARYTLTRGARADLASEDTDMRTARPDGERMDQQETRGIALFLLGPASWG